MSSLRVQIGSLALLLLPALPGSAQTTRYSVPAASVQDRFAAYHQVLNSAADDLLASNSAGTRTEQKPLPKMADQVPQSAVVRQFAQQYWNGEEENVVRALERVAQLRPTLEPILREQGVPPDVAAVVLVESGGRPTVLSPKGALGLWQFMPETARRYGLVISPGRDERTDVVKSTRAAARYLRELYSAFGDWRLVLAAYNAGEQTIQRALGRSEARDFRNLVRAHLIPTETQNYVPAVLSAVQLLGGNLEELRVTGLSRSARVLYAQTELTN